MNEVRRELIELVDDTVTEIEETSDYWTWITEQLSIEEVRSFPDGSFKGIEICVGSGGPAVYVETDTKRVEGFWSNEEYSARYDDDEGRLQYAAQEMYG